MSNRQPTPGEKKAFGVVGLISSTGAFACGISLIVGGKTVVRGHQVMTPQNDPWEFWGGIAICFISGAIILLASIHALAKASGDDTP